MWKFFLCRRKFWFKYEFYEVTIACLAPKILGKIIKFQIIKIFHHVKHTKMKGIFFKFNIFNYINLIYVKAHSVEITLKWKFYKHCHYFKKTIRIKQLLQRCGLIASVFNTFIQIKGIKRRELSSQKLFWQLWASFLKCKNRKSLQKIQIYSTSLLCLWISSGYWTFRVSFAAVVCFWFWIVCYWCSF